MRAKKPARRFAVSDETKAKARDTRQQRLFQDLEIRDELENRIASKAALMRRTKKAKAEKFSHAQDASEAQWNLLSGMLDTDSQSTVVRYVEWANQMQSNTGSHNKYGGKIWLSRIFFIRAIDMAMKGYNELTSEIREMLVMEGFSDEAIDQALASTKLDALRLMR